MRAVKPSQHLRQQVRPRCGTRAHGHESRPQALQLDGGLLGARHQTKGLPDERLDDVRRGGRPNPASGPLKQAHAEERLEPAQVL